MLHFLFAKTKVDEEGKELRRFLVPVRYLSHTLFIKLLKESEEVYKFQQEHIRIPCKIKYFLHVNEVIDRDNSCRHGRNMFDVKKNT
ncbi:hypothetical protein IEQ34_000036 [Dendrobium chrysotoxum]|uniref:Uncharacterized protein n=1 Tax=Dendrobium chrysotoxum TaxID=161865 RepID=A0AAV7HS03_DENCH|nr:hypothetical protein IEQ34_000036 [Dendrobium chrysotoxum]